MHKQTESADLPEHLVLPTMSELPQGFDGSPLSDSTVDLMLVPVTSDGSDCLVALAFTSVPLLVEALGQDQTWITVRTDAIQEVLEGSGAQAVLIDPRLGDGSEEPVDNPDASAGSAHG